MRINILPYLLIFLSISSCQQVQEKTLPMEANAAYNSVGVDWLNLEKSLAPATNIVFQSTDGGQSWQDISAGLPGNLQVDGILAQNDQLFLGCTSGLFRSQISSEALVWEKEFLPNEQFTGVFPGRDGLYARSKGNGFFRKTGGSGIWLPVFADLKNQHFRNLIEALDGTLFIGTDNGIFKSTDQGKTWKHVHQDGWMIHMVESDGVLICTNQRGILRSTDGGEHWDLVISEGGVGIAVEVIEGGFAAITYNTESKTRRVRISADGGKTWQPIDADLPPHANIASIKQAGEYFFCGHPDGVFRSADQGKTWKLVLPSIVEKVFNLSVSGKVIYAIPLNVGC